MKKFITALLVLATMLALNLKSGFAQKIQGCKTASDGWLECEVGNSHYTGWDTWTYIDESGILKKWGDKFKVRVKITMFNSYGSAIDQYTGGGLAGVTITNMDVLIGPATGGVKTIALIVGDYSNGNDAVLTKKGEKLSDLKNRSIIMVQNSVSDYLWSRWLDKEKGYKYSDFEYLNSDENQIVETFQGSGNDTTVVTWNPWVLQLRQLPNTKVLFDSSKIPGEILDLMVVRADSPEALRKALVGAWYEGMKDMSGANGGKKKTDARKSMAKSAGCTLAEYEQQLKTTAMFYTAAEAVKFTEDATKLKQIMDFVRQFCFKKGLLGNKAKNADDLGIKFPDDSVLGDKNNVMFIFDSSYIKMAGEEKL